tara:strand:+ start:2586 stop:2924 length:339 start_codon:yes stop_codon:yes gene_type:complete
MKSIIATGILLGFGTAAVAGPYVNVESNSGFAGSDYATTTIETHVGFEGDNWYIQAGPAYLLEDAGEADFELSGKVGASVPVNDSLSTYGELSFLTGEVNSYGVKAGAKYSF